MILVLLGTQPLPFDRLIHELIDLAEAGTFEQQQVVIQAGKTQVDDPRFIVFDFIAPAELDKLVEEADLIITHGGAGSMFAALRRQKRVIALARSAEAGEHVDEHQFELVEQLFHDGYLIGCKTIKESFTLLETFVFKPYHSAQEKIIAQIQEWIN